MPIVSKVKVSWQGDGKFLASDDEGHSTLIETRHQGSESLSPSQLFLASLGACSAVDVVEILKKRRKDIKGLQVEVTGERMEGYPTRYRKIQVTYTVKGPDIREEEVRKAVELSQEKYCSVSLTVKNGAEVVWKAANEEG